MNRLFSLAHLTALACSPPDLIHLAAKAGYDFVSLRLIHMNLPGEPNYELHNNRDLFRQTKSALAETGMKLLDVELAKIQDHIDPKRYVPAMEVAAELGGRHVLSSIWTDNRSYAVERFAELCELAKPLGLTVDLEFVPIASVHHLWGALDVLQDARRDNAGLMLDTFHWHHSGMSLQALEGVPREWFHFLHLCDSPAEVPANKGELTRIIREERLYVGEGCIDIAGVLSRIPEIPCSIEVPHSRRAGELGYEEFARRCLQTAKDYVALHLQPSL